MTKYNMLDIIEKKKLCQELTADEIKFFVMGYTDGAIPDYQVASLLMAIRLNGMTMAETYALTDSMLHSGDIVDLSHIQGSKVDKHSTGGVGDSTTLALAPILACCGVYVAKMSGRGLGFTGGTIDKLESIPGFDTSLSEGKFFDVVNSVGCSVIGQTGNLAPADKKLYALRDVTGTVDCMPLICSSIMSKKLASGSDIILLDVKYGNGAFMPTPEAACELASAMVDIGNNAGKTMGALITDMGQPLSEHVGNSLEIIGIINVLNGAKTRLYRELMEVACRLLSLTGKFTLDSAGVAVQKAIDSGEALTKLADMVEGHGGDKSYIYDPSKFVLGTTVDVLADADGYVVSMDTADIGRAVTLLGGGRMTKEDVIDFGVGVVMNVEIGTIVKKGDTLCTVYHNSKGLEGAVAMLTKAIHIGDTVPHEHKIAYAFIDKNGTQIL